MKTRGVNAAPKEFAGVKWTPLTAPRFRSRRAEAAWWEEHQDALAADMERAAKNGKLTRGRLGQRLEPALTRPTTLRLLADDIAEARRQAATKGLRYQTYLKMLIHEALQTNGARSKSGGKRSAPPSL